MITITGDKKLVADLTGMAKVLPREVEDVLDQTADFVKDDLSAGAPVNTGALADSMAVTKKSVGYREIGAGGSRSSDGSLPRDYAIFAEEGASAHWPNIKHMGLSDEESFLVARAISRKPQKAYKFFEATFDKVKLFFYRAVENSIEKVVR